MVRGTWRNCSSEYDGASMPFICCLKENISMCATPALSAMQVQTRSDVNTHARNVTCFDTFSAVTSTQRVFGYALHRFVMQKAFFFLSKNKSIKRFYTFAFV